MRKLYSQEERASIRERALSLIAANNWTGIEAAGQIGVSATTLRRMEDNGDRWAVMAHKTVARLEAGLDRLEGIAQPADVVTHSEPVELVPVARHTGMLNERTYEGQPVYSLPDVAEGLGVTLPAVYNVLDRRSAEFLPGRDVIHVLLNGRSQTMLTRRGAMRVAMHSHGPNALALQNHLLDLDEAVATGQMQPVSEVDKLARILGVKLPEVANQIAAVQHTADEAKAMAEEALSRADDYDPKKLRALFIRRDEIEKEIEGLYVQRGEKFNFSAYRRKLKTINDGQPVSRFSNSITVAALEIVVKVAEELLADERRRGVRLFDGKAVV
jgi:prophage antirepressor-like protein